MLVGAGLTSVALQNEFDYCLNQDFNKIYKISRINNLGNHENLIKISVQDLITLIKYKYVY